MRLMRKNFWIMSLDVRAAGGKMFFNQFASSEITAIADIMSREELAVFFDYIQQHSNPTNENEEDQETFVAGLKFFKSEGLLTSETIDKIAETFGNDFFNS